MKAPTAKITRFRSLTCGERIHVSDTNESFIAMAPGSDELLVLKRLRSTKDPGVTERFMAVAEVARRFDHPGLCRVTDHGPDHLVRAYAEGKDLRAVMRRLVLQQQQIAEPTALLIALEVCRTMEHVYSKVRADDPITGSLGAQDVVLTYEGAIRLIDPIAPGEGLDPGADVAAIGALLHEMLTGSPAPTDPAAKGDLDPRVLPLVRAGFTDGLAGLKAAIEGRLASVGGGQASTSGEVAALVNKVFAQARRSDRLWRRQLSAADEAPEPAAPAAPAPAAPATAAPASTAPAPATPAPAAPALQDLLVTERAVAPTAAPAPESFIERKGVQWAFGALVLLSVALLGYRGALALRTPRALLSVESDQPAEIVIDGEQRLSTPLRRLSLSPGEHKLVFRFARSVLSRTIMFEAKQHLDLRLR